MEKNPYKILGVDKETSQEEIKSIYRKLSKTYHPDHNPDDKEAEDKFKEISAAYAILSDPKKRADYDNPMSGFNINDFFNNFGGPFGNPFGPMGRHRVRPRSKPDPNRPLKGLTIEVMVHVPFTKFILNDEVNFKFNFMDICVDCKGTGASKSETCVKCNGNGQVVEVKAAQGVYMQSATTCLDCRGRGATIIESCEICDGSGKVEIKDKEIKFKVNKNMRDRSTIRLQGAGGKGMNGGPGGDLLLTLDMVLPDKKSLTEEQIKVLEEMHSDNGEDN